MRELSTIQKRENLNKVFAIDEHGKAAQIMCMKFIPHRISMRKQNLIS